MRSEEQQLRDLFSTHFAIPNDDTESVELLAKLAHTQKHKPTPAMDLASDSLIEITPDIYGGLEFPMERAIQQMLELGIDSPKKMMGITKASLKQAGFVAARRNKVIEWQEKMKQAEVEEREARTAAGIAAAKARAEAEAAMRAPPPVVGALRNVLRNLIPMVDDLLATDQHSSKCNIHNCRLMATHKLSIGPTSVHHRKVQPGRHHQSTTPTTHTMPTTPTAPTMRRCSQGG